MSVDPRILPTILTVIDVLAAIAYAFHGAAHFRGDMVTQI